MDVIEKLIGDHMEVKEELDILSKLIQMSHSDAFAWDNAFKISSFFDKEVKEHFRLEEEVLFPVMEKIFPQNERKILNEIKSEHKPIEKKLDEFKKISEKHSSFTSPDTRKRFVMISKEIIEDLIPHAKKEDNELFPLVKKLFSSENYKELEDLYFKYLKV